MCLLRNKRPDLNERCWLLSIETRGLVVKYWVNKTGNKGRCDVSDQRKQAENRKATSHEVMATEKTYNSSL